MSLLDNQEIKFACPQCGNEVRETFGKLRAHPYVSCSGCGADITVQGDELQRIAEAFDKTVREISAAFGGIGKRR